MSKFTQEDLVRYLYKETSEKKSAAIEAALLIDYQLKESLEELKNATQNLHTIHFSPSTKSVNNILKYAANKKAIYII